MFASILQRLEWRLRHDSNAVRCAFELPLDALSGRTPAEVLAGSANEASRAMKTAVPAGMRLKLSLRLCREGEMMMRVSAACSPPALTQNEGLPCIS